VTRISHLWGRLLVLTLPMPPLLSAAAAAGPEAEGAGARGSTAGADNDADLAGERLPGGGGGAGEVGCRAPLALPPRTAATATVITLPPVLAAAAAPAALTLPGVLGADLVLFVAAEAALLGDLTSPAVAVAPLPLPLAVLPLVLLAPRTAATLPALPPPAGACWCSRSDASCASLHHQTEWQQQNYKSAASAHSTMCDHPTVKNMTHNTLPSTHPPEHVLLPPHSLHFQLLPPPLQGCFILQLSPATQHWRVRG
jgi:hypothetical protein